MAQSVRSRALILALGAALAGWALAGCGERARPEEDPPRQTRSQEPAPPAADLTALTPPAVVDRVLEECLGPVREGMDRAVLRLTGTDGESRLACIDLPERLRLDRPGGGTRIANGSQAWDCPDRKSVEPLAGEDRERLFDLRELLDAATFGPLSRARAVERQDAARYRLLQPDGTTWTLFLREGTLLPAELRGPRGSTRFVAFRRTTRTWMPEHVVHDGAGEYRLRFEQHDVQWDELFFADPTSKPEPPPRQPATGNRLTIGGERRPTRPEPGENRPMFWLVLDDPGDWPARAAQFERHWPELQRQGQKAAGFVAYCRDGERRLMVIPFRPADGRPFVRPEGWQIVRKPRQQVLVVYPETGSLQEKIAAGTRMLLQAVRDRGLTAVGPVCAQPYLRLEEGVPGPEELDAAVVRMSVAVQ